MLWITHTGGSWRHLPEQFGPWRTVYGRYRSWHAEGLWHRIVEVHHPGLKKALLAEALTAFYRIRDVPGLKKKPSTSELLDWIKLLVAEDIPPEALRADDTKASIPPLYGALLKNEQDMHLFEQLVFLNRRAGRSG